MNEVNVTGKNATIVIDDKDTVNVEKTINKTVNVVKSDNTQLESDVKIIQTDLSKLSTNMNRYMKNFNKKLDLIMKKLKVSPVTDTQEGNENE